MRAILRTSLPQLGLRACLAFFLAGGFGFRVVAVPATWGCMTAGPAAPATGHPSGREPGDRHHGSHLPACECIAHASPAGLTVEPLQLAPPTLQPVWAGVARSADGTDPATSSAHILPFSIGPPQVSSL
jgi:hypothetical protein